MSIFAANPMHRQLAEKFCLGDETGLSNFFKENYSLFCLYANRICEDEGFVAEVASEAFYQTRRQRWQLHTADSIKAYLYTIVRRTCVKYIQRKKRLTTCLPALQPGPDKTVQVKMICAEAIRQLHQTIRALSHQCQAVCSPFLYRVKLPQESPGS